MGWWRSLLPCCGVAEPRTSPGAVSTFSCCCCGMNREPVDTTSSPADVEKTYIFLENYCIEKKILNPTVPFVGELPVPLYPGRVIIIEGIVLSWAIRMSVNVACGSSPVSDLAFHLNPRFEQNLVVRNYRLGNHWGEEETSSARRFPFKRGQRFQMQIFATQEEFLVAFDGEHFCAYTFRLPLLRAQLVQVNGDVEVTSVEFKQSNIYPLPYEGVERQIYKIGHTKRLSTLSKGPVETPFTGLLLEGMRTGSGIEILGRVKLLPTSFYINLQDGSQVWPHPIVAYHLNPRFRSGTSGGVIANSWHRGHWGKEIKSPIHQFRPGRPFSIKISCEEDRYAISIDEAEPSYFTHRVPPGLVNSIYIHGDVWLKDLYYISKTDNVQIS